MDEKAIPFFPQCHRTPEETTVATLHLTQNRVDALTPKKAILDVRDTELKGFGIRIMSSGRQTLLHSLSARGPETLEDL